MDRNLPVVMITGYKEAEKVIEAFRNGAMDCLLKPFNFDYIKNNVLPHVVERKK
jgi:DNA-binding NtrC family response regulator